MMHKQIEEMEKVIEGAFLDDYYLGHDPCENTVAVALYNAGYRKQSEVVKEFVMRFEKYIGNCTFSMGQFHDIKYALKKAAEDMLGDAEWINR